MNKPFVLAMFGTSGSGKTTIGEKLNEYFRNRNENVIFIDGDDFRDRLDNIFGYTDEDRVKVGIVANAFIKYLIENNISVITAAVGANEEIRARRRHDFENNYIECYVKCSFDECCRRDPKGYYKKYLEGKMENFNVLGKSYSEPKNSEIVVNTEIITADEAVEKILAYVDEWKLSN